MTPNKTLEATPDDSSSLSGGFMVFLGLWAGVPQVVRRQSCGASLTSQVPPDEGKNKHSQNMFDPITILVSTLSGGAAGSIITLIVTAHRDKHRGRRAFRVILASLREQVIEALDDDLRSVYSKTSEELKAEALKVAEDIRCWNRRAFKKAWRAYCDATTKNFANTKTGMPAKIYEKGHVEYRLVRLQMLDELDSVATYAS